MNPLEIVEQFDSSQKNFISVDDFVRLCTWIVDPSNQNTIATHKTEDLKAACGLFQMIAGNSLKYSIPKTVIAEKLSLGMNSNIRKIYSLILEINQKVQ